MPEIVSGKEASVDAVAEGVMQEWEREPERRGIGTQWR
jgi:hypothetical protein